MARFEAATLTQLDLNLPSSNNLWNTQCADGQECLIIHHF